MSHHQYLHHSVRLAISLVSLEQNIRRNKSRRTAYARPQFKSKDDLSAAIGPAGDFALIRRQCMKMLSGLTTDSQLSFQVLTRRASDHPTTRLPAPMTLMTPITFQLRLEGLRIERSLKFPRLSGPVPLVERVGVRDYPLLMRRCMRSNEPAAWDCLMVTSYVRRNTCTLTNFYQRSIILKPVSW